MKEKKTFFIIAIVITVITFLYCILPIDFIPDFITGIGWLDDLLFVLFGFIGSLTNFFIGLGLGKSLAKEDPQPVMYEENFGPAYGSYREL